MLPSTSSNPPITHAELEDGRTLPTDMLLLSIGVRPSVSLAVEAGLKLGPTGAIAVNPHQQTSDPDIYAAGDAAEVTHAVTHKPARIPLAGPANRQGRHAGQHAATSPVSSAPHLPTSPSPHPLPPPVLGTAIVQLFSLSAALTGLSEPAARAAGFDVDTAYVLPNHHASFYPGASPMRIKLIYDRSTTRLLGAQIVGHDGVDKRIDVLATLLHFGGTLNDLANLDLAYAPQFASAKDPLHIAAFTALNQLQNLTPSLSYDDLPADSQLLDVRTPAEYAKGSLPGATNIPLDSLRSRLTELDPQKPTVVFCQIGQRGHTATRLLLQHGFHLTHNLKGGYSLASPLLTTKT